MHKSFVVHILMSVIVNATHISIYFASDDNTVTHRFTTLFGGRGKKPTLNYYRYDCSLSIMLRGRVPFPDYLTVHNYVADMNNNYVYFNDDIKNKHATLHVPGSDHFQSIVRIMQGGQCTGSFADKESFPGAGQVRALELSEMPPTFGIQEWTDTRMHRSNYGVILQPVGDDQLTYEMVKRLTKLPDNFTIVKCSYDLKQPAHRDDKSYHTVKLYDEEDSTVAKVEIHDNLQDFIDLSLLLQEIFTWIVITKQNELSKFFDDLHSEARGLLEQISNVGHQFRLALRFE